jgi:hypothetical protein
MSNDWLREDLWRAHVSWLSPPWVGATAEDRRDFDAGRWLDQLQAAHYRTLIFYAKHHDGWTAYPSRLAALQPERDYLGECAAEAHRRGMRIMVYYSSVLDQVAAREHPDWRVLGRDGQPPAGWYDHCWPGGAFCCINNPGYRDYVLAQLSEMRDGYHPDGFWLDVFEPCSGENCFCPFCREKCAAQTWGDLLATQGQEWYESCFVEFMAEIRDLIKRDNPDCVLGCNTGRRIPGEDDLADFLTHEGGNSHSISMMCRSLRTSGKPFEITMVAYSAVQSWTMRGPERLLLESMTAAAQGGACAHEVSPTHAGRIMEDLVAPLAEVGAYVRAREPYLLNTEPVYDAALLERADAYGRDRPVGWAEVLTERDVPFGILRAEADLTPYQLVILDDRVTCDEGLARRLQEYVRGGGSLIVEAEAAAFGSPAGEVLSEVLGVRGLGGIGAPAQYVSALNARIAEGLEGDALTVEGEGWRVQTTTAEPLAHFRYEFAARSAENPPLVNLPPQSGLLPDPAITLNTCGKGRAMYLACPLTAGELRRHKDGHDARPYPVQLAANLARFMIGEPLLEATTPAGVEVIVNVQGKRHIVHLLNHYVSACHHDNRRGRLRLARVPVSVNELRTGQVRRAFRVGDDGERELPVERRGNWAKVVVPELGVHEMVVLEH